nr:MAG TPA: RNHCP domain protein [Crassvirales sp.]
MKQNFWCRIFNLHKFEVYKETPIKDRHDNQIGLAIVSRCTNCGKVKSVKVYTEESYER